MVTKFSPPEPSLTVRGFKVYQGFLDAAAQENLVDDLRSVVASAPMFSPCTPRGKPMSVRMTSAGRLGWYADSAGYRYRDTHPSGRPWPAMPEAILSIWDQLASVDRRPDCCLINYYDQNARMGLHQDKDEVDFDMPVVSVSLGDDGLFRIGNLVRGGSTESLWLNSGDVVVMGGEARLTYHGVDRIRYGSSKLLNDGGRLNLTLRVVT